MSTNTTEVANVKGASIQVTGRDLTWYQVDSSVIDEAARKLLINYSGISPENIGKHVDAIREKAFNIWSYPCIGMYRFLDLSIMQAEVYQEVVERLKGGDKLLDLGCCFGQEIRQLVSDGVPSENCYGSDLRAEFLELGYELFKDKGKIKSTFIPANVFEYDSPLMQIYGQMSVVYTGSFFHLFDWDQQFEIAKRVVQLLKPESGVMVIGRQMGNDSPGDYNKSGYPGERGRFRHNAKTWAELWDEVGEATGTQWKVDAILDPLGVGMGKSEEKLSEIRSEKGARRLRFVIRRV